MSWRIWMAGMLASAALAGPVGAQVSTADPADPGRLHATRAHLEELLKQYEQAEGSELYSEYTRSIADDEASLIRHRLEVGDFQIGDQVVLIVIGQPALTNTFTVTDGQMLILPEVGAVSLKGLLRSELQDALSKEIAKFYRDPQVQTQANIRLAVWGEIGNPGYLVAPSEKLLQEVIMLAGGPGQNADQKDIRIKRNGEVIWEGEALQEAIVEGRTIDQLNLRAGDEIEVPGKPVSVRSVLMSLRAIPYLVAGFFALSRLF